MKSRQSSPPPARRYDGRARQADAAARRRRVVEVAHRLFVDQGYGTTSISQVATEAGVAAPTVYAAFESKAGLLARVVDIALVGHDEPRTVREGDDFAAVAAAPDARARVRALARGTRTVYERSGPVLRIVESVAGADEAVGTLRNGLRIAFRTDVREIADTFAADDLRAGIDVDAITTILLVYAGVETWSTLTIDAGMTPDQYEEWLVAQLDRLLLT